MSSLQSLIEKELGIKKEDLHEINGGYQNLVFNVNYKGKERILRLSNNETRNKKEISSEIEWCSELFNEGISVVKPVMLDNKGFICSFSVKGILYHAVVFETAKGAKLSYPDYLGNEKAFEALGTITGQMHRNSKDFAKNHKVVRPAWYDNVYLKQFRDVVPEAENDIVREFGNLLDKVKNFPVNENSFGLIHGDINVGNFHVDNGKITLFDFDECQWSWYVEDLAISLFYTLYVYGNDMMKERVRQGQMFLRNYLRGYIREKKIDLQDLSLIPDFLRMREIIVYVGILKKWKLDNLNQWQTDYLSETRLRIGQGKALLEVSDLNLKELSDVMRNP